MSNEVRHLEYENGSQFIINFKTGQVYARDDYLTPDHRDYFTIITFEDAEYILLNDLIKKQWCDCSKKDCYVEKITAGARELVAQVLKDACDS